jgi:hypothetical protein
MKSFRIAQFSKEIKVVATEEVDGVLVSGCEYRKRKTVAQVAFETAKWEKLGYALAA